MRGRQETEMLVCIFFLKHPKEMMILHQHNYQSFLLLNLFNLLLFR